MKTLLLILCCLVSAPLFAQNPSFKSFSTNDFRTNGLVISINPTTFSAVGATLDGAQIFSSGFQNGSDNYFLDCARTNSRGQILIYRSILATNNCNLILTNAQTWSLLSVNIISSGTNATITFPTNLPHLDTNGLTFAAGRYSLSLSNGNEFRLTIQSNITLSTLWATFGQ